MMLRYPSECKITPLRGVNHYTLVANQYTLVANITPYMQLGYTLYIALGMVVHEQYRCPNRYVIHQNKVFKKYE